MRRWILLAVLLVLGVPALAGPEAGALPALRRAHAKRLTGLAAAAREARLGGMALRLYREAIDLDPENAEAREALGWTRDGAAWRAPDPRVLPGEGWPDDGEAEMARLSKKEAAARDEHVRDLLQAGADAKARKDPGAAPAFYWAAVGLDPADPAPRRALAHAAVAGAWIAPEHRALAPGGEAFAARARLVAEVLAAHEPTGPHEPLPARPAGWARPVPAGGAAGAAGDAVHALTDPGLARDVALRLARARRLYDVLLGPAPGDRTSVVFLHVGARDLADALIDAEPGLDRDARGWAKRSPVWPLGRSGYELLVADTPQAAADAAVTALAERITNARSSSGRAPRWLTQGLAQVVTGLLLGAPRGYAATATAFASDVGPVIRPGEGVPAFARRMAAAGADPSLAAIAAKGDRALHPRDVAKAGAVLDWLFLRGPPGAIAFVGAVLGGGGAASVEDGARAAGFPEGAAALEDAWRRYAFDLLPAPAPEGDEGGTWRVAKLERAKSFPAAESLFLPVARPVAGSLWFGGRPFTCEVAEGGAAVRLWPLETGQPLRVVREAGTYPFKVPREYGGGFTEVRVALDRAGASWTVRPADAVAGMLDGHSLAIVDLDLDGRYGSFGRDGVAIGKGAYLVPLLRTMVLGGKAYELRRVGPDGREIAWRSRPLAAKGTDLEGLLRWNAWRIAAGLPPLDWDAEAVEAARAAGLAWGTGEGRDAAEPAGLWAEGASLAEAVRRWMARPDRRIALLEPGATRVGAAAGLRAIFAAVSPGPESPASPLRGPLVGPPPGAEGVPTMAAWGPGGAAPSAQGVPITLRFGPGQDVEALRPQVALATANDRPVEVVPADAAVLAAARAPVPSDCAVFLPLPPLAPKAVYKVTATWGPDGARASRSWTFTTGD